MSFSIESIKNHMDSHHQNEMLALVKKYGGFEASKLEFENIGEDGFSIMTEKGSVFIPFLSKVSPDKYVVEIKNLCKDLNSKNAEIAKEVAEDIKNFKNEFNSIILATLDLNGLVCSSYAPLLKYENEFYIYISEVSEHFINIKTNPKNVEVMLLEDESKAKTVIARKRLRYRAEITFIERGKKFDDIFDAFICNVGKGGGVDQIRNMTDFHLIHLKLIKGRFVRGFGQAYDVLENGDIIPATTKMPHSMPNKS